METKVQYQKVNTCSLLVWKMKCKNSVKKTNRLVCVEESWPLGCIASEVAFKVQKDAFDYLDAPVVRVTGADVPMSFSIPLIEAYLPNVDKIIKAVNQVMYR